MKLQTYLELKEQTEELDKHKYWFKYVKKLIEDDTGTFMTSAIVDSQVKRSERIAVLTEEVQDKILQLFNHNAVTMMQISDRLRNYGNITVKLWVGNEPFNIKMVWDEEDSYYVYKNIDDKYPQHFDPMYSYMQIVEFEDYK